MNNLKFVLVVALAVSATAMASDMALYIGPPNPGWYDAAQVVTDAETIVAQTGHLFNDVQQFDDTQFDEFAEWIDARTDDGVMDIIWLNGTMPSVLYPFPNLEPDGSRAELWLDGGNMLINVADWFGYMSYEGGSRSADNGGTGAANILDLSSGIIVSADGTTLPVTDEGHEYLPSLDLDDPVPSDRPVVLNAVQPPWEVAAVFASNGTQADPVVIHNTENEGYVAFINQAAVGNSVTDRGLTTAEFIINWVNDVIGLGRGNPLARRPNPQDGALYTDTWVTLSWNPGTLAVSHDVYLGEGFDDVNNATKDSEIFRGNQASTFFVAGFPGFPYPDGLVPGTTYYWRIDEVNDAEPNSPWKGPVWSFAIPSRKAYDPVPADNAKFIDPEGLTFSWTGGFGAKLHTVYFGDSFDDVNNASGGLPQGLTSYTPAGPLEPGKTYYWRVDEFDALATHKGDVWSFVIAKEGGGIRGDYYKGMNFESFILTRIDPQIDFNWGDPGGPDPLVGNDQFSARWTGEVEAAFTETYTFYPSADDGVRLWVNGEPLVNAWIDQGTTEYRGTIDLVAGNTYSLVMEYYVNGGGAVAQLRWSSPSTPKQIVPQAALSLLVHASSPKPASGIEGVNLMSGLAWKPGEFAASHDVYFGTDADAVANATTASPEYKGSKALGDESYDPGKLAWDTTYYWRIDEVNNANPDSPWKGNVWIFDTGPFLLVDDFESYDDIDPAPGEPGVNRIFDKWIDGFGTTDNGALVGNDLPPYAEQTIVHGGAQSMIYRYDNANKTSEASLTLVYPRDWTEEGVMKLSLWLRGSSANSADRVYVALNGTAVVYHDDPAATQLTGWNEWVIDLAAFPGVNLAGVNTITIGIGTKGSPAAGGTGTMYFDDIRLYR